MASDPGIQLDCNHSYYGPEIWQTIQQNSETPSVLHSIRAPAWVSEPQFRGTFSILQTCTLTLVACVYTALHLNVATRRGTWHLFGIKLRWVLLALFAPEIVVYTACSQLIVAWDLCRELKGLQEAAPADSVVKRFDFSLRYAYFVVMGGIGIEASHLKDVLSFHDMEHHWEKRFRGPGASSLSETTIQLTPGGVYELARSGHWLLLRPEKINDKSKADGIQKALVFLQISWMVVSCVARAVLGLPLTLLEVHTMVHVVCALVMYGVWFQKCCGLACCFYFVVFLGRLTWQKPMEIRDPELVYNESWKPTLALMAQCTMYPYQDEAPDTSSWDEDISQANRRWNLLGAALLSRSHGHTSADKADDSEVNSVPNLGPDVADKPEIQPPSSDPGSTRRTEELLKSSKQIPEDFNERISSCRLPGTACFSAANNFLVGYDASGFSGFESMAMPYYWSRVLGRGKSLILRVQFLLLNFLPVAYGGVHLAAWSFHFPSETERLLWRVACITILGAFVANSAMHMCTSFVARYWIMNTLGSILCMFTFTGFSALLFVFYGLCRVFVVVEAYISLRDVPVGVYWTPAWLQSIPHV